MNKYKLNLGIFAFIVLMKIHLGIMMLTMIYLFDTNRTTTTYELLFELLTTLWLYLIVIIYWIVDMVIDMFKKRK